MAFQLEVAKWVSMFWTMRNQKKLSGPSYLRLYAFLSIIYKALTIRCFIFNLCFFFSPKENKHLASSFISLSVLQKQPQVRNSNGELTLELYTMIEEGVNFSGLIYNKMSILHQFIMIILMIIILKIVA